MSRSSMEQVTPSVDAGVRRIVIRIEAEITHTIEQSSPRTITDDSEVITSKLRSIKKIAHHLNEDYLYTEAYDRISAKLEEKFIA